MKITIYSINGVIEKESHLEKLTKLTNSEIILKLFRNFWQLFPLSMRF